MNKKTVLFTLLVLLLLGATFYLTFVRVNKRNALQILGEKQYGKFDKAFLIAWAKAVKKNESSFAHDGKNFEVSTGRATK